jgi:hypothetical protein
MENDPQHDDIISSLDRYLAAIKLDDVELSVRAKNQLWSAGANTLLDAQRVLTRRSLGGATPLSRKTAQEAEQIVKFVSLGWCQSEGQMMQAQHRKEREVLLNRIDELKAVVSAYWREIDHLKLMAMGHYIAFLETGCDQDSGVALAKSVIEWCDDINGEPLDN